jgi:glycosyltransferase involved in cell wall biosynthesis
MFKNKKIGVVIRAYNEEELIASVIDTIPDYVDKIYVVNDASTDKTREIISNKAKHNRKIVAINRETNGGVGAVIISGHSKALQDNMDVIAVMDGDGQMDPAILDQIIMPIVDGKADYSKGNRLSNSKDKAEMPVFRAFGNVILTFLSRISSGYWHISDPQNGYTAISTKILKHIDLLKIERGYAFENNMLARLNVIGAKVVDIPHPAIYRGQKSKIRYGNFIFKTSWILFKDFIWRIWMKYFQRKK